MDLTLFKEGFVVMVIGMGTVFVFLTIMIWVMNLNSYILKIVNKYFPEELPVDKTISKRNLLLTMKKLHWLLQLQCINLKE